MKQQGKDDKKVPANLTVEQHQKAFYQLDAGFNASHQLREQINEALDQKSFATERFQQAVQTAADAEELDVALDAARNPKHFIEYVETEVET